MEEQHSDIIDQFTALKEALTEELAGVEVQIARIEQDYTILLPEYYKRKDALVHALFDEPPVEITLEDHETDSNTNAQGILVAIRSMPGSSKQDLREIFADMDEKELNKAIAYCSKNNKIENRGTKQRPRWFAVE